MTDIHLRPWERKLADYAAKKRQEANRNRPDARYYDRARMQSDEIAAVASICAEVAVAKRLNRYYDWSHWTQDEHETYRGEADVGGNVEVRRIREPDNPLVIRPRDVEHERIMVLAYPVPDEFTTVKVIGWGYAASLYEQGKPASYDSTGGTRLVPQGMLDPL